MDASTLDLRRLILGSSSVSGRRPGHHHHLGLAHGPSQQWTDYLLATALAAGALAVGVVATRAARKFLNSSSPSSSSSSSHSPWCDTSSSDANASILHLPTDRPVRISITLRNTALWSPSSDPSMPNFAFIEGAKTTLVRQLAANPRVDLHVIAVVTSQEERTEVVRLLGAAGVYAYLLPGNVHLVDPWMVPVEATGELAGMPRHLVAQLLAVKQIRPDVHIEGSRSTRAVRWIANQVPGVVWVHPRMARASKMPQVIQATTATTTRPTMSRGNAAAASNKHLASPGMSQGDSAVDVGLSSPSSLTSSNAAGHTSFSSPSTCDGLPPPAHADLAPAAAGEAHHTPRPPAAVLTPSALFCSPPRAATKESASPHSPTAASAASGALASAEWSSSSSSSGTTTGTAAAAGLAGDALAVPPNVLVTERLADWGNRASALGAKVVEYGLII